MEFSRQEYWIVLLFSSPGDLLDPGIKPMSRGLQADFLPFEPSGKPHLPKKNHHVQRCLLMFTPDGDSICAAV